MVAVLCFLPQLPLTNVLYDQHHPYIEFPFLFTFVYLQQFQF